MCDVYNDGTVTRLEIDNEYIPVLQLVLFHLSERLASYEMGKQARALMNKLEESRDNE
ncbi:hypothetical protein [Lentibacillus daqui]|uniref:hypothetical protein n=1 Tax=Lentibacillus daqui TaxID=2911514 RepID=UPI0022B12838|nr:hypothetical protein [Lentibacillus daqui]